MSCSGRLYSATNIHINGLDNSKLHAELNWHFVQLCHTNILWHVSLSQTKGVCGVPPRFHISLQDVLDTVNPRYVTQKFALDF